MSSLLNISDTIPYVVFGYIFLRKNNQREFKLCHIVWCNALLYTFCMLWPYMVFIWKISRCGCVLRSFLVSWDATRLNLRKLFFNMVLPSEGMTRHNIEITKIFKNSFSFPRNVTASTRLSSMAWRFQKTLFLCKWWSQTHASQLRRGTHGT